MRPEEFSGRLGIDVSRETIERLSLYERELNQWSRTHNLIGPRELDLIWERHFLDCYQIVPHIAGAKSVVDIGSGAGFPGLVAACAKSALFDPEITLVEPNSKRCAFLRHVTRQLNLNVVVLNQKIEDVSRETFDVVTSRAVTNLTELLRMSRPWIENGAKAVFLKGQTVEDELTAARRYWNFKVETIPSRSDSRGVVLSLSEVSSRHG